MRKPVLLRVIFRELRASLGPSVPGADVAKLAHIVLRAYTEEPPSDGYETEFQRQSRSFSSLPVDEAMRDGGWRVLEFESEQMLALRDRDVLAFTKFRPLIEKYLGPEWQHQSLTGQI